MKVFKQHSFRALTGVLLFLYAPFALGFTFPKEKFFDTSLGLTRYNMIDEGTPHHINGNALSLGLGVSYFAPTWFLRTNINFHLGPYEPFAHRSLTMDFFGTGLGVLLGLSAQGSELYSPKGGYGFALGLNYADIIGRSIGGNKEVFDKISSTDEANQVIDEYQIRINDFAVMPAFFFSWLKKPRPIGNTPDLLVTRLEGYILTLGLKFPIKTTYLSRIKYASSEFINTDNQTQESVPASLPTEEKQTGVLSGYSFNISMMAIFD